MDAKAKVVAWQYRRIDLDDGSCFSDWIDCDERAFNLLSDTHYSSSHETRALIPLTDHETALAELENLRRMYCTLEGQYQVVTESKDTLLTGLEALAGEARRIQARAKPRPDDDGADRKRNLYRVAKLLTLTNSAKDST